MAPRPLVLVLLCALPVFASSKIVVTVIEQKSGAAVTGLKASDFTVLDDKTPRTVEAAEYRDESIDVMLLLDSSLVGGMVQPVAKGLIAQLRDKEQMAVVSFANNADLIQDFTNSKELLSRSLERVRYGNEPNVLDALYAAMESGFEHAAFRRTVLLLTTGYEGGSRVRERDVVKLARRNGVSIYPVYVAGMGRSLFENLARQSGGASFNLRDMSKAAGKGSEEKIAASIFGTMRAHYVVTVAGNLALGEKLKVEVKRPEKLLVSALPLE